MEYVNPKDKFPSEMDVDFFTLIRESVDTGVNHLAELILRRPLDQRSGLEIAPQDHKVIGPLVTAGAKITTLDLDPMSGADIIGDICETNSIIPESSFDFVICTEVIEHVDSPSRAVDELIRITKKGGLILITSPFNFRLHGPLPDNWRISEWGWRTLLKNHNIVLLNSVESPGRNLFPVHYRVIVENSK